VASLFGKSELTAGREYVAAAIDPDGRGDACLAKPKFKGERSLG
jgi:hypothetical protein